MSKQNNTDQCDIFRDTPIRYLVTLKLLQVTLMRSEKLLGIISEKKMVLMTYGIASMYVLADTCDKSWAVYYNDKTILRNSRTVFTAMDTLLWQALASVMIPGFTINRLCYFSNKYLCKMRVQCNLRRPLVTGIGLLAIPFIIRPIDNLTDILLDETLRKCAP